MLIEPLISIVTICFNEEKNIKRTIESILNQTYKNIEFIVIDGKSTDNTLSIINEYEEEIDVFISEKDKGIYDAMNKANQLANGEYIFFLNSGDFFSDNNIIQDIIDETDSSEYSLITARTDIYYQKEKLDIVSPPLSIKLTKESKSFSHQGTLIHKNIYKRFNYNLNYKISADKEYWLRINEDKNFNIIFHNKSLASFELGGVSNNHKNVLKRRLEDLYIEYYYSSISFKKILSFIFKTSISFVLTINEPFYFKKIYPLLNKIKNYKGQK